MKLIYTPRNALGQLPRCTHQVCDAQLTDRMIKWRADHYGEEGKYRCRHFGVYTLDGVVLCGRHTGMTLIDKLVEKNDGKNYLPNS